MPQDDGACDHLTGMTLPPIGLPSTRGRVVDLSRLAGTAVVYVYPRTGRPDQELPTGWNAIPGARGCTPQSCGFRDLRRSCTRGAVQRDEFNRGGSGSCGGGKLCFVCRTRIER